MNKPTIGANGGIYRARFKNAEGAFGSWLGLGGGLKSEAVEVELVSATPASSDPMWAALLDYVLDSSTDDPLVLLHLWREGSFAEVREGWPDIPAECFPAT